MRYPSVRPVGFQFLARLRENPTCVSVSSAGGSSARHPLEAGLPPAPNRRRRKMGIAGSSMLKHLPASASVMAARSLAGKPAVRRITFAVLRRMFRWSINRGDIEHSPMSEMDAPAAATARDRVLSDDEIALVWAAAEKLGYPFGPLTRLLLVTGQRREEVGGLAWSELDRSGRVWLLPAARAKNKQPSLIPLSELAIEILDGIAAMVGEEPKPGVEPKWPRKGLVFTTTGKTAASGFSKAKTRLDGEIKKIVEKRADETGVEPEPVPYWRLHDLRRTVATGLQRLGVRFEVTEAVLNHVSGARAGVAGIYQRHDWKEEKRNALDQWAAHVSSTLTLDQRQPA